MNFNHLSVVGNYLLNFGNRRNSFKNWTLVCPTCLNKEQATQVIDQSGKSSKLTQRECAELVAMKTLSKEPH